MFSFLLLPWIFDTSWVLGGEKKRVWQLQTEVHRLQSNCHTPTVIA